MQNRPRANALTPREIEKLVSLKNQTDDRAISILSKDDSTAERSPKHELENSKSSLGSQGSMLTCLGEADGRPRRVSFQHLPSANLVGSASAYIDNNPDLAEYERLKTELAKTRAENTCLSTRIVMLEREDGHSVVPDDLCSVTLVSDLPAGDSNSLRIGQDPVAVASSRGPAKGSSHGKSYQGTSSKLGENLDPSHLVQQCMDQYEVRVRALQSMLRSVEGQQASGTHPNTTTVTQRWREKVFQLLVQLYSEQQSHREEIRKCQSGTKAVMMERSKLQMENQTLKSLCSDHRAEIETLSLRCKLLQDTSLALETRLVQAWEQAQHHRNTKLSVQEVLHQVSGRCDAVLDGLGFAIKKMQASGYRLRFLMNRIADLHDKVKSLKSKSSPYQLQGAGHHGIGSCQPPYLSGATDDILLTLQAEVDRLSCEKVELNRRLHTESTSSKVLIEILQGRILKLEASLSAYPRKHAATQTDIVIEQANSIQGKELPLLSASRDKTSPETSVQDKRRPPSSTEEDAKWQRYLLALHLLNEENEITVSALAEKARPTEGVASLTEISQEFLQESSRILRLAEKDLG